MVVHTCHQRVYRLVEISKNEWLGCRETDTTCANVYGIHVHVDLLYKPVLNNSAYCDNLILEIFMENFANSTKNN